MISQTISHARIGLCIRLRRTNAVSSEVHPMLDVLGRVTENRREHLRTTARRVGISAKELTPLVSQLELLSLSSAQAELGVSRSTVYRLIEAGELDRVHVRSLARVTRRSMDRYVSHQIEVGRISGGQL